MATRNGSRSGPSGHDLRTTGTVEQVSRKGKRTALKVNGRWFSTFEALPPVERGDEVEIAYRQVEKNGRTYFDIVALNVKCSRQAERESHIDRSVALKAAATFCAGRVDEPAVVLEIAEQFLAWLEGAPETSRESEAVPF